MKRSILHLLVKTTLKSLSVCGIACKGIRAIFTPIGKILSLLTRAITPGVLFFYLKGRQAKKQVVHEMGPLKKRRVLYGFSHRYFVHALVALIVIFASTPSLLSANTPTGAFGEGTLLRELVEVSELNGAEEIIIDDVMPASNDPSYIEARFFNQQRAEGHDEPAPLPLSLDFSTVIKQDLPGTTVPLTRTEINIYIVETGDTCWSIADKFGVSVSTILWANNLNNYCIINPGKELTVLPISGVSHTVNKGDTLGTIAKRYGTTADKIAVHNNIDEQSILSLGDALIIPGGRPYVPPQPAPVRRTVVNVPSASTAVTTAKCVWPVKSQRITQYYWWQHTGLDIGDKTGSPMYVCADGVVEIAGWGSGGWGYTVLVDHGNGFKTRYAHASKILVEVGQSVSKGDVIALVGSTGRSTGSHLHMGVYVNGKSVNPLEYLK